jgi:hypothetical protein
LISWINKVSYLKLWRARKPPPEFPQNRGSEEHGKARLKHFLWKIAWDILPSRANIGKYVVSEVVNAWSCPFCGGPLETLTHIFLECALAKFLWSSSPWYLNTNLFSSGPISEWIMAVIHPFEKLDIPKADSRKFQLFVALVMDFIWLARNKLIHEASLPNPMKIIQQLKVSLEQHLSAWRAFALPSLWLPPDFESFKGNFDVAIREDFAVAAAVISDSSGEVILAATKRLSSTDVLMGEAAATFLATWLAVSTGVRKFLLEGDALLVILAVDQPLLFSSWQFSSFISDIRLDLSSFLSWNARKVSKCAIFRAHALAKWAAIHHVFGSISTGSPILSSIRIKNGKNPPL